MKFSPRSLFGITAVFIIAMPLTLIITFLLYPLWSWLDVIAGIESLSRAGPANWCYEVVYLGLVIAGVRYVLRKKLAGS
jgi:hypothetical protein